MQKECPGNCSTFPPSRYCNFRSISELHLKQRRMAASKCEPLWDDEWWKHSKTFSLFLSPSCFLFPNMSSGAGRTSFLFSHHQRLSQGKGKLSRGKRFLERSLLFMLWTHTDEPVILPPPYIRSLLQPFPLPCSNSSPSSTLSFSLHLPSILPSLLKLWSDSSFVLRLKHNQPL